MPAGRRDSPASHAGLLVLGPMCSRPDDRHGMRQQEVRRPPQSPPGSALRLTASRRHDSPPGMPHKPAPACAPSAPPNGDPPDDDGHRKDGKWTRAGAAAQARKGAEARWAQHIDLSNPEALADASLRRLLWVGKRIQEDLAEGDGRERLERAKVLVTIDQAVLDRVRGKPRAESPTPEAGVSDYKHWAAEYLQAQVSQQVPTDNSVLPDEAEGNK